ncbi:putative cyclic nucleotide-gated ion channel 5 [Cocos nucifera]|uniref:Putative cyclic nucleotide-gated ion channel 5 n=1 Tax=Cocos nucifera TaxID=13894 RepID=A0A8K0MUJ8_COCNU|nr:putative cyclic nucleotide-gated ion channel 5 [Cocos nucifera]
MKSGVSEAELQPDYVAKEAPNKQRFHTSVWVARKPPGFAFIDFDDRRDAQDAIRELDGKNGWRVELSHNSSGGSRGRDRYGGSDMKCYECGEPGHFARECRLRIGSGGLGSGRRRSRSPRYRRSPSYGRSNYCSNIKAYGQAHGYLSWFNPDEMQNPVKPTYWVAKPGGLVTSKIRSASSGKSKVFAEDHEPWRKRILDPGSDLVLKWNWVFLISCLVALFIDPLYFYLPSITIKFRTAYIAPSSRVFGRGELVMDPKKIARRYLRSDCFVDLAAALPLPQIVIWLVIPAIRNSRADHNNNALALIVLIQYIPRLYLISPLSCQIIKATGVVTKTAWAGAAYNLLLYMIASHVLGASWYLLSVERLTTCWKSECKKENGTMDTPLCDPKFLDCDSSRQSNRQIWTTKTTVFTNCDASNSAISFNFGIFSPALTNDAVSSGFIRKYFYCLWWGLQNLSSYGQTLTTSTYIGETLFAILIAILGLVLFAHLIGNMQASRMHNIFIVLSSDKILFIFQTYLQSITVPFFSQMDDQLLDAICERLVSSLSTEGTYIVREGDPVTEMLFIIRGRLESSTTNGGRTGFFNSIALRPGDFCGEELLAWALLPKSTVSLPSSTRTVRALVEVEGFALRAEELKFVANQFRRLHSRKLQHTFRFYSHHWRTWAACFIQAAWRRFKRRKMAVDLNMRESLSSQSDEQAADESGQEEEDSNSSSINPSQPRQNLEVTILASKFAASTRKGVQKIKGIDMPKLQKPDEPDFSADPYD